VAADGCVVAELFIFNRTFRVSEPRLEKVRLVGQRDRCNPAAS